MRSVERGTEQGHLTWRELVYRGLLIVQLSVKITRLDFVINRFFMKLFKTSNIHMVSNCQEQFNFALLSVQLARRSGKFLNKLHVH